MFRRYIHFVSLLMAFLAVVAILPVLLHRYLPPVPHDYFAVNSHAVTQQIHPPPNTFSVVGWNLEYMLVAMRTTALELIGVTLMIGTVGSALVSLMRGSLSDPVKLNASDVVMELEGESDFLEEEGVAWAAAAELQDNGTINYGVPLPPKPPGTPERLRLTHSQLQDSKDV